MPPLRRQALMVGDGVALEEVHQREGRGLLFEEHGADPGRVRVVDPHRAPQAPDAGPTVQARVTAVEQVSHVVLLRPADRGAQKLAPVREPLIALDGPHADRVLVRTTPHRKVHAGAVDTALVQLLEEGRRAEVVPVHPPDVVVEDLHRSGRDHRLPHRPVDDDPPLLAVVPGVAQDAALRRRRPRGYRRRRRRRDAREDRDRVPDRLPSLGQETEGRRVPVPDRRPQHVRPDAVEHHEQHGLGHGAVLLVWVGVLQCSLIVTETGSRP